MADNLFADLIPSKDEDQGQSGNLFADLIPANRDPDSGLSAYPPRPDQGELDQLAPERREDPFAGSPPVPPRRELNDLTGAQPRTGGAITSAIPGLDTTGLPDRTLADGTVQSGEDLALRRKQKAEQKAQAALDETIGARTRGNISGPALDDQGNRVSGWSGFEALAEQPEANPNPAKGDGTALGDFVANQENAYQRRIDLAKAEARIDKAIQGKVKEGLDPAQTQSAGRNITETALSAVLQTPQGFADAAAILGEGAAQLAGLDKPSPEEARKRREALERGETRPPVKTLGEEFKESRDKIDRIFSGLAKGDVTRREDFDTQLAQGAGSTVGFAGAGAIGKALGLSNFATTALAGAFPEASQLYTAAEAKGLSKTQQWLSFILGLGIGASEAGPISQFLENWNHASGGFLRRLIVSAAHSATEEGLQEGSQQVGENLTKRLVQGDDVRPSEGVGQAAAVGALTGAGFAGGHGALHSAEDIKRLFAAPDPPKVPDDVQSQILQELRTGGPAPVRAPAPIPQMGGAPAQPGSTNKGGISGQPGATAPVTPVAEAPQGQNAPVSAPNPQETAPNATFAPAPAPAENPQNPQNLSESAPGAPSAPSSDVGVNAPSEPISDDDARLLIGSGLDPEVILDMTPAERADALRTAREEQAPLASDAELAAFREAEEAARPVPAPTQPTPETAASEAPNSPMPARPANSDTSGEKSSNDPAQTTGGAPPGSAPSVVQPSPDDLRPAEADATGGAPQGAPDFTASHTSTAKQGDGEQTAPQAQSFTGNKPAKPKKPLTLTQFIASRGGLAPSAELNARDLHKTFVPGHGRLVRKNGMALDRAREAAVEAGYLQDTGVEGNNLVPGSGVSRSTTDDLLNGLEFEASKRGVIYTEADRHHVPEREPDQDQAEFHAHGAVLDHLAEMGLPEHQVDPELLRRAAELAARNEASTEDAYEQAVMEFAASHADVAETAEAEHIELPGFDDEPAHARDEAEARQDHERDEQPRAEPAPQEQAQGGEHLPAPVSAQGAKAEGQDLADAFAQQLRGGGFKTILQARKLAKEHGVEDVKAVEEALELAVVNVARDIVREDGAPQQKFDKLLALYDHQPNLGTRTSTSVRDQAYSTPIPLAYVASRLAGVDESKSVLEPTAGNGALLIEAGKNAVTNEINGQRATNLVAQGFRPTAGDASERGAFTGEKSDVVIANPPFGTVKEGRESKRFDLSDIQPNYTTTEIDHAIALRALETLKAKGRAVLILGAPNSQKDRSNGYNGKAKREFFKTLYDRYNVVDHFTVDGDLYKKQGAGWPVDVIVIDGRGKSALSLPAVAVPPVLTSWDQVRSKLDAGESTGRGAVGGASDEGAAGLSASGAGRDSAQPAERGAAGQGDLGAGNPAELRPGRDRDEPGADAGVHEPELQPGERAGSADAGGDGRPDDTERRPSGVSADEALTAALDDAFGPAPKPETPKKAAKPRAARTPKQTAVSAATNTVDAFDKAGAALEALFGFDQAKLNSGFTFDEETYKKAVPIFKEAFASAKAAAQDLAALAKQLVEHLKSTRGWTRDQFEKVRPYLTRFLEDVKAGTIALGLAGESAGVKTPAPKTATVPTEQQETATQVAYAPRSAGNALGTLTPVNMRDPVQKALEGLESRVGNLHDYVAEKLEYDPDQIGEYFAAEQMDALALAIDNLERGAGFIIGDQTGIGKGRVNAGIIRYALVQGHTPIFVTEKPNLFGDMYRDLSDTGIQAYLGREPKLLATNSDLNMQMDEGGKFVLKTGSTAKHDEVLTKAQSDESSYDIVFTTYNQMQTVGGGDTVRRRFLQDISPGSLVIFDESHNAGGQTDNPRAKKKGKPMNRAEFARMLVDRARGVFYSSATYAKRPDVMDLYRKTDMRLAVPDITKLGEAIARGGVPLQQITAMMLTESGQYVRRERSFAGVRYETPTLPVNRTVYDDASRSLAKIQDFSEIVAAITKKIATTIKSDAQTVTHDGSTGGAGAASTNFTSIMHNVIGQMLLSIKAKEAARMAVESLNSGEKPVIALASTMESFLKDYADEAGLSPGDAVDMDVGALLDRYLERTRWLTIRRPFMKEGEKGERVRLTDEQLGQEGRAAFKAAREFIRSRNFGDLPVSPVDAIRAEIKRAGYSVGEITGRGLTVEYEPNGTARLKTRPQKEITPEGRRQTINAFNAGKLDVVILNQAGATGLSLHASEKFADKRPRHMIIAQAEANVDTHMQMLGRIHRTGQVVLPRYSQVIADVPAEKRPAAVLAKKMASLNANTTASRKGALAAEGVVDFLNEYGDRVADAAMHDDPDLYRALAEPINLEDGEVEEDAMRKVTGRIPLLPIEEQERVYDRLESDYKHLIEELDASGQNALEAKNVDLDAKLIASTVAQPAKGESPFARAVTLGEYDVKRQGKPYSSDEMLKELTKNVYGKEFSGSRPTLALATMAAKPKQETLKAEALAKFPAYVDTFLSRLSDPDIMEKNRVKFEDVKKRFVELMDGLVPGSRIRLTWEGGEAMSAVVLKVNTPPASAKNPLAFSGWRALVAVPDGQRTLNIPFNRIAWMKEATPAEIGVEPMGWAEPEHATLKMFDDLALGANRETRVIATGNLLAAYAGAARGGRILNFTTADGKTVPGIMLPAKVKSIGDAMKNAREVLTGPKQVLAALENNPEGIQSADENVTLSFTAPGRDWNRLRIEVAGSKKAGGQYYLDKAVTDLTGDFYRRSGKMSAEVSSPRAEDFGKIIKALMDAGAKFTKPVEAEIVKAAQPLSRAMGHTDETARAVTPEQAHIEQEVRAIIRQQAGPYVNILLSPERFAATDKEAARSSGTAINRGFVGYYDGMNNLIAVSLDANRPLGVSYHETMHFLHRAGAITPPEWNVLHRERERMIAFLHRANPDTERNYRNMPLYEVAAYANQEYQEQRDEGINPLNTGLHIAVRNLFERLRRIFEGIRRFFRENPELREQWQDLVDRQRSGEWASRVGPNDPNTVGLDQYERRMGATASTRLSRDTQDEIARRNAAAGLTPSPGRAPVQTFQQPERTMLENARSVEQDSFARLQAIQNAIETARGAPLPNGVNAYLAQTLFPSRSQAALKRYEDDEVSPITKALIKAKVDPSELGLYLLAKHAEERNATIAGRNPKYAQDGGSGMATQVARGYLADFAASGRDKVLEPLAQQVYALLRRALQRKLDAGLITQKQFDQWTNQWKNYVPLRGVAEEDEGDEGFFSPVGKGFDLRGKESKAATGRESLGHNPYLMALEMGAEAILRAEKNKAGKALLALAQQNPHDDEWEVYRVGDKGRYKLPTKEVVGSNGQVVKVPDLSVVQGENAIGVKVGGKQWYVVLTSPNLAAAYKNLGPELFSNPFFRGYHTLTRQWAQLNTGRNPEFFINNFRRDVMEAASNLFADHPRLVPTFAKLWTPALQAAANDVMGRSTNQKWDDLVREWQENGGKILYNARMDLEARAKSIEAELKRAEQGALRRGVVAAPKALLHAIDGLNDTLESATRLAVYAAAREHGMTPAKAAQLSLDMTVNFNRKGRWSSVTNTLWAFSNAATQGSTGMMARLVRSNRYRAVFAGMGALGFGLSLLNHLMWPDDDDPEKKSLFSKIPEWERSSYLLLPYGVETVNGVKRLKYWKVLPMAFGFKIPWGFGEQMAALMLGQTTGAKAAKAVLSNTLDAFNPIGQGSPVTMIFPSLVRPLAEWGINENWLRHPIVPKAERYNAGLPHSSQYAANANPAAVTVAQKVNELTGGDKFARGYIDAYPAEIEHFISSYTGGAGKTVMNLIHTGTGLAEGVPLPFEKTPVLRQFMGATGFQAEQARYYEEREEFTEKQNRLRAARKALEDNPQDEVARRTVRDLAAETGARVKASSDRIDWTHSPTATAFTEADSAIKEKRAEQTAARTDKNLTGSERQKKVETIETNLEKLMRRVRLIKQRQEQARKAS